MAARKLQSEIDKVLKKIDEYIIDFDETWDKVEEATQPNVKEKHEADLKKDIKKLQRLRDQVKTWAASNDVKRKQPLLDARARIEEKMEAFKALERESKTKAFSKLGLSKTAKQDPTKDPKYPTYQWLDSVDEQVGELVEDVQNEIKKLRTGSKRKVKENAGAIEEAQEKLDRHIWHQNKLIEAREMLEKDETSIANIERIKEDVQYYIDEHMDPDFYFDDMIYETLAEEIENSEEDKKDDVDGGGEIILGTAHEDITESEVIVPVLPSVQVSANYVQPAQAKDDDEADDAAGDGAADEKNGNSQQQQQQNNNGTAAGAAAAAGNKAGGKKKKKKDKDQQQHQQQQQQNDHQAPSSAEDAGGAPPGGPTPVTATPKKQPGVTMADLLRRQTAEEELLLQQQQQQQQQQARLLQQQLQQQQAQQAAPKSAAIADAHKVEYLQTLKFLEPSLRHLPTRLDSDRPKSYVPRNPFATPASFPSTPDPALDDPAMFAKFDLDTLFFIFYFQQGTSHQYLAARELKRKSWRYHTSFLTWFKRYEGSIVATDEFERGSFVFFDYDAWATRVKRDFTFEYRHLEE